MTDFIFYDYLIAFIFTQLHHTNYKKRTKDYKTKALQGTWGVLDLI